MSDESAEFDESAESEFDAIAADAPAVPEAPRGHVGRLLLVVALLVLLASPLVLHAVSPLLSWRRYEPQEGDILFQSLPRMEIVNAIEGSTDSPWSHCGLVCRRDGQWVVREALGEVRDTPLNEFFWRGRDGRFAAFRLKEAHRENIPALVKKSDAYLGRPYDTRYRMDDESIYCSELIWKAYHDATGDELGRLVALGDLKWRPYRQVIERLEGGPVPTDREMITPRDLARAEQLERVAGAGDGE